MGMCGELCAGKGLCGSGSFPWVQRESGGPHFVNHTLHCLSSSQALARGLAR